MPGAKCCINGCQSTYYVRDDEQIVQSNISFRRFPKDEAKRKKWISNIKMFNKQTVSLQSDSRICGLHFDEFNDPVYFPAMTSPGSTRKLEYLISDCDEDEDKENREPQPPKRAIRYPGDIKTKSVEVDVLKRALHQKQNQIKELKAEVQRLKKQNETYECKLEMVYKVLDSLVNKKYLGSEMVNMIKVSLRTLCSEGVIILLCNARVPDTSYTEIFTNWDSTFTRMVENPQLVDHLSESRKKASPPLFQKIQSHVGDYCDEVKKFALTLSFYSRRAYIFVRHAFNNQLPHIRTISKWLEKVDGSPGFTRSAIPIIKKKIEESAAKGKKLKFSLQVDGMHLRSKYTVDKTGKTTGKADFGNVKLPPKEQKESSKATKRPTDAEPNSNDEVDTQSIAKESLTFLVNCVNDRWKMPVAYFLIHKLDTDDQAFLIEEVIYFLECNNIDVLCVTFDGLKTNLSTARKLGACLDPDNLQPYFYSFLGTKIYILFDICHMLKLIRNNFYGRKQLINRNGKKIFWTYLPTLHNIQQKEKLHLGNRITKRHIKFTKSKMKVNLAAQLLSNSVAASLRYLATDENYKNKFKNVEPTAEFIEKINNLFDIFNSRRIDGKTFGQAFKPENIEYLSQYLEHCVNYIKGLQVKKAPSRKRKSKQKHGKVTKYSNRIEIITKSVGRKCEQEDDDLSLSEHEDDLESGTSLLDIDANINSDPLATVEDVLNKEEYENDWEDMYEDTDLEAGYEWVLKSNVHTGFLGFLVAIESFKGLYREQVVEEKNLDYIFTYKFSQDHIETFFSSVRARGGFNDNPSPAQFRDAYRKLIMNKGVKVSNGNCKLEEIICVETFNDLDNSDSVGHFIDDEEDDAWDDDDLRELVLRSSFECSEYKANVLAYIAGFIKKKILKIIDCSTCLKFLNENEEENTLLKFKQWGNLTKANDNLIKMCKIGESVFNQIDRFNQKDIAKFSSLCFRSVNLNNLSTPMCNVERISNHTYFFVKMIFDYFLKIRLHHAAKLDTFNATQDFIRNQCKKLPLFKNQ